MARTGKSTPANGEKPVKASSPSSSSPSSSPASKPRSTPFPLTPIPASDRDVVKVNNASLSELKNAADDAVKRFLSRPDLFKQSHVHTDVRLGLGWAGVFVAGATAFYGWRLEFEQSKPAMWVGLIVYVVLTVIQTLYAYFIEGDIIFVGKRKTFDKRIVTERITLTARTTPSTPTTPPAYALALTYNRSSNGGKSLLYRGQASASRPYNTFFDEKGVLEQDAFESWVGDVVGRIMEEGEE
ncbi:hypothetical protein BV25DRAFT_1795891 [Artomyces pyxidatus]|uniref:Uncharacterized protein n=1 Tax=Artomyces pyxidatus TaxID=48021 RepID=A0ACB8TEK4_9AGAM|nr:hypothetical protein BV25DRAFT_1795891 [Artomyces pyxidatus]